MNYPPPVQVDKIDELPDYYLGRLIVYEPMTDDRCRWVVYDGNSKVRCYTRTEAIDYINETVMNASADETKRLLRSRYFLLKTMSEIDAAARFATGANKLLLERLSVRLRPYLVEIDNYVSPIIRYNEEIPHNPDQHQDAEAPD